MIRELMLKIWDEFFKLIPAIITAISAYQMWKIKANRERVNEIIRALWALSHFCKLLENNLTIVPQPSVVDIEPITKHIDVYFDFEDIQPRLYGICETHLEWVNQAYHGASKDTPDIAKRMKELHEVSSISAKLATSLSYRSQIRGLSKRKNSRTIL
jgi:hypothetical protein